MDDDELTKLICRILAMLPGWAGPDRSAHAGATVAVFYGAIGAEPDQAVGVRVYGMVEDDREIRRVQLRFRGPKNAPDGADRLADIVRPILTGISREYGISGIRRLSLAPLGADNNGREERADNYYIILDNPEAST